MNLAARMNLQRGKPENKVNEWTNYRIEGPLDAYMIQRQASKEKYGQQQREQQFHEALEGKLESILDKALKDLLESWK